uniref:Uncharacterized protein n=1 Tax=Picea sitchensis TaxID=3332 RepID=A0A6B9XVK7_PICSI|nr:hypothetical protein Q903MT_gene4255 [Picea sitchensis]
MTRCPSYYVSHSLPINGYRYYISNFATIELKGSIQARQALVNKESSLIHPNEMNPGLGPRAFP